MNRHRTVRVSVKAFVDEGVAPLVVALDAFDENLLTVDSCEDDDGVAYVMFLGNGASGFMIGSIRERLADVDDPVCALRLINGDLYEVRCRPASVAAVARALTS